MLNRKQWLKVRRVFHSIYLSLIRRPTAKLLPQLYDVPRSIAEDPRIAFLQSNLFWQVSCAKSKTKACTEISAWTICLRLTSRNYAFVRRRLYSK